MSQRLFESQMALWFFTEHKKSFAKTPEKTKINFFA